MDWRNYEHYIYYKFKDKFPESNIEFNKKIKGYISGRSRQIDLYIEGIVAGETFTIIVDCKYFDKKIDIKIVESFLGFVKDVKGNKGILITNKGFTKSAYSRAYNDQNSDIKLEIIEFEQLYPFQGAGAIIHRGYGGAVIQAPEGWVIDGKRIDESVLASILPYGLSVENAFKMKEVVFCNTMLKEGELTIEKLIESQDENRLIFDDKSELKINPIKLNRYDNLDGIYRKITYPQAQYFDYTIFLDFGKFIFYACLVEGSDMKNKHMANLYFVVNNAIPLNVQRDIYKNKTEE
ncbi:restriction endonuclease [uncultured Bacteroides sp.]|uniref:restriction endonuclease n=1 Tax=uncultured Bacteroides sp. TaxID=162156 RepID=UPI002AABCF82|nr:restriction endonuclease [uncultured Bacteroides sp.]